MYGLINSGGRRVLFEWLKERRGSQLAYDEKSVFQRIVEAVKNLIALSRKVDETLDAYHGIFVPRIDLSENKLGDFTG